VSAIQRLRCAINIVGDMRTECLSALGGRVRTRRERLSFSQTTLARRAGVHPNVVGRLERGIYNPSVLKLLAIARALRVLLRDLG
jgi:transcriptional regulator with XRE-family HTH domain